MHHSSAKKLLNFAIVLLVALWLRSPVFAAVCTGLPSIHSLTSPLSNCVLTVAAVTGVDEANNNESSTTNTASLTLNSGASVTINTGGSLAFGSITINGGTIAIDTGGAMLPGSPIYTSSDADIDGWLSTASSPTLHTATLSGRRRLSLMRSLTVNDCSDASSSDVNFCCAANGASCAADGDCCNSVCGTNADGDNYFSQAAGHSGTCQASALAYTDCYDANANAYPGSATCSSTNRGDGSYDYDCSSTQTVCGTTYGYACSTSPVSDQYCSGNTCSTRNVNEYATATTACGAAGCTCTATANRGTACTEVGGMYPSCTIDTTASYCTTVTSGSQSCQ